MTLNFKEGADFTLDMSLMRLAKTLSVALEIPAKMHVIKKSASIVCTCIQLFLLFLFLFLK